MLTVRKAIERGHTQLAWLDSYHSFSFGEYHDLKHMGFSDLRVINEDKINPAGGFGLHSHNNMEIITYIVAGALTHKDSLGTGAVIRPGEIQRMSAGTGIKHSEFNHSNRSPVHLLQLWIRPEIDEIAPGYEQKKIHHQFNEFILIGAPIPQKNTVMIHQDVQLFVAYLNSSHILSYSFKPTRVGWLQLIKGIIKINGIILSAGDGVGITTESNITIKCLSDAELLFFDLKSKS